MEYSDSSRKVHLPETSIPCSFVKYSGKFSNFGEAGECIRLNLRRIATTRHPTWTRSVLLLSNSSKKLWSLFSQILVYMIGSMMPGMVFIHPASLKSDILIFPSPNLIFSISPSLFSSPLCSLLHVSLSYRWVVVKDTWRLELGIARSL